ncbi:MAG: hypothetical protein KatS3mg104_0356 [Phycisphaerae bacterium]|jgi:hypothetical protein|nr:MAG: hypothetical protein KatS3mg104_0356 [Phycisphaerae bacterium]
MSDVTLNPDDLLVTIWSRLQEGSRQSDHPFHLAGVASLNEIQGVTLRTMVLRKTDPETRSLMFHTDRRSSKFADLLQDPALACLFYDPKTRVQVRIQARATLHTQDAVAQEQWKTLPDHSRLLYTSALPPGTEIDSSLTPARVSINQARDHFAVIVAHVDSIEWLYLHPESHQRIRFTWQGEKVIHCWLVP